MSAKNKDWLEESLRSTRKFLADLPAETKIALDNDAKFQAAIRANEQAALVAKGDID